MTFGTSTSTLPSSLLSAMDDGHRRTSRTSLADSNDKPRISYTLDSTLDSVNKIEQTAEQYAQRAGFDEDTIPYVAMAVREAAVNAVSEPEKNAENSTSRTMETICGQSCASVASVPSRVIAGAFP